MFRWVPTWCAVCLWIAASLCVLPGADAALIVDTGTPTGPDLPAFSLSNNGVGGFQNLAGFFTTSQDFAVTGVQGHINVPSPSPADLTFAITGSDGGGLPDLSNTLFSDTFTVNLAQRDWTGPSGLNWNLGAGSYWLVLLPEAGFSSSMPGGAPNPLAAYAVQNETGVVWTQLFGQSLGFRVFAEDAPPVPIPEPTSMALWSLLLCGAGGYGWRRRRAPLTRPSREGRLPV